MLDPKVSKVLDDVYFFSRLLIYLVSKFKSPRFLDSKSPGLDLNHQVSRFLIYKVWSTNS